MSAALPTNISRISKLRFNALAGYSRQPYAEVLSEELAWFEHRMVPVLGVLLLDRSDADFGGVIVGKDQSGRYRCIDINGWYERPDTAQIKLMDCMNEWARRPAADREQDTNRSPFVDVFAPAVPPAVLPSSSVAMLPVSAL
jgi:hypothetical protein